MGLAMSVPCLLAYDPFAAEEAKLYKLVTLFKPFTMATEYVFPLSGSWLAIILIRRYIITKIGVAYL